ncbi:MAG: hypothetical protein ACXVI9_07050, partial [Mucilaginibacter sp.]
MKILKKYLLMLLLPVLLLCLSSRASYAQTVYDWTGALSTNWTTAGNWKIGAAIASNYPGQISTTDVAQIGVVSFYHLAGGGTTTNQPYFVSGAI